MVLQYLIIKLEITHQPRFIIQYSTEFKVMLHMKLQMQVMNWQQVPFLKYFHKQYRQENLSNGDIKLQPMQVNFQLQHLRNQGKVHRPTAISLIQVTILLKDHVVVAPSMDIFMPRMVR